MTKDQLRSDISPFIVDLQKFQVRLAQVIETAQRTVNSPNADGSNGSAMDAILELLEHEYIPGSKIKGKLNRMHQLFYKNAVANLAEKRRKDEEALIERAPGMYKPRTPKKAKKTESNGNQGPV